MHCVACDLQDVLSLMSLLDGCFGLNWQEFCNVGGIEKLRGSFMVWLCAVNKAI